MNIPTEKEIELLFDEARERCIQNDIGLGWIDHSYWVAEAAKHIARALGKDENFFYVAALFHDIGRCIPSSGDLHAINGYKFMCSKGYLEIARYCWTHEYHGPFHMKKYNSEELKEFREKDIDFIKAIELNDDDKIIQLADFLAVQEGYVTIEQRTIDILRRGRIKAEYILEGFNMYYGLKLYFDDKIGKSVYEVIPNFINETLKFKYGDVVV